MRASATGGADAKGAARQAGACPHCISAGEFDISLFLTLLVAEERRLAEEVDGWHVPNRGRDAPLWYVADSNARAA